MISSHDVNSYAEPDKVVIKHLALDLGVDFDKKVLAGTATLDLDWKDPDARSVVLDTRDLDIAKIEGLRRQHVAGPEVRSSRRRIRSSAAS